eukprot:jgi/Mesen1/3808/ME000206S02986
MGNLVVVGYPGVCAGGGGIEGRLLVLEAPALEEGLVERYPPFVNIVLNHVSEDSAIFARALSCLRILLESLGYKLWVHTNFSPSVVRNTLMSQCFNSAREALHADLFALIPPFL